MTDKEFKEKIIKKLDSIWWALTFIDITLIIILLHM